jgi:glycosyltransferase involved in cell wall biosynthesis
MARRVLFVSKPIAPPWHDGSKNLVRDVAAHLTRARPTVLSTPGAPSVGARVTMEPVYAESGRFAPALAANARVLLRLLRGDPHDIWHFVFAPNVASSSAAMLARRVRVSGGWEGKVVQTVASAPRRFEGVARWIFGDLVVALSEWTRGRLMGAGVRGEKIRVIPPCAAAPERPSDERVAAARARFASGEGPIVLYPGDYEVSRGAETVAAAVGRIVRAVPEATVVFACRPKTRAAESSRARCVADLERERLLDRTRHVGEIEDMPALLAASSVVAFPVDDLYGKVDIPLVLLEAMALGVPIVACTGGPLETLSAARLVEPADPDALADEVLHLLMSASAAREASMSGKALYERKFQPSVVAAAYDELYEDVLSVSVPP